MTPFGNGTGKKIAASVIVGLILLIIGMVLSDERRIAVLETQMNTIERGLETNRKENNEAHDKIQADIKDQGKTTDGKLSEILREMRKK